MPWRIDLKDRAKVLATACLLCPAALWLLARVINLFGYPESLAAFVFWEVGVVIPLLLGSIFLGFMAFWTTRHRLRLDVSLLAGAGILISSGAVLLTALAMMFSWR
jgi:hypothetical protein